MSVLKAVFTLTVVTVGSPIMAAEVFCPSPGSGLHLEQKDGEGWEMTLRSDWDALLLVTRHYEDGRVGQEAVCSGPNQVVMTLELGEEGRCQLVGTGPIEPTAFGDRHCTFTDEDKRSCSVICP